MIGLLLCLLTLTHPSDVIVDSMVRDWYENGWFAERYEVDYVEHINITNISQYGRYEYDEGQYLWGFAYTTHVGYYDRGGFLLWHQNNCFLFYYEEESDLWHIEAVPFLPLVDPRASPHRDKGSKI